MKKYYYIATNQWGHGRSLEPNNGWGVTAYTDKEKRDEIYDEMSFERTGCTIPSIAEISEIFGTNNWGVCEYIQYEDGGYDCGIVD